MSAGSVVAARLEHQQAGGGAIPTPALQDLLVRPIPFTAAKAIIVRHHYLHSLPGGTQFAFGVFLDGRLLGAVTLGVGPVNAYRLVRGAASRDCLTLTRLWLSDELPSNSESRVLGVLLRSLCRHTTMKFMVSYADPSQGHLGTIYQATGWLYTGLSDATPLFDCGDGVPRHSRTLSNAFGTHSVSYFQRKGFKATTIPQAAKHRYIYFLYPTWQPRLVAPVLPYPKKESIHEDR
ncbi:DNA methyltransferase [Chloroflexota bacterium]